MLKIKTDKTVFKGALILAVGTLFAKIIGALYRLPLANIIKSEGLGLYQMVFPVYTLLLEFSGAAAPSALSAIISGYTGSDKEVYAKRMLKNALCVFAALGLIATLTLTFFSNTISALQGDRNAAFGYILMSPSVFFVALISCYRGYFQGLADMTPTAISQIVEQIIKLCLGLIIVSALMPNVPLAVGGATLSISVSEAFTLLFMFICYKRTNRERIEWGKLYFFTDVKSLFAVVFPVMLVGIVLPISHIIDSVFIINTIKTFSARATSLFGLLSGAANTVINLPVALCYGIGAVAIPAVAAAKSQKEKSDKEKTALFLTLFLSFFCAVGCYLFAPFIVKTLFGGLSVEDAAVTVRLLKISAGNIVFISVMQTANAIHVGRKTPYKPLIGLVFGIAIKTAAFTFLLTPALSIYGGAICLIACNFFACLVNLLSLIEIRSGSKDVITKTYRGKHANA